MFTAKMGIKNRLIVALILPLFLTVWTLSISSILFYILYILISISLFLIIGMFNKNFLFQEENLIFEFKFREKILFKKVMKKDDIRRVDRRFKGLKFTQRLILKNGGYYDLKQFERKDGFDEMLQKFLELEKENQAL